VVCSKELVPLKAAPISGHGWVVVEGAGISLLGESWDMVLNGLVYFRGVAQ
jgi:hypothetical protein